MSWECAWCTVHDVNVLAEYLFLLCWCHDWHTSGPCGLYILLMNQPTSPDVVHTVDSDVSYLLLFVMCNRFMYVTQVLHFPTIFQNVNLQKKKKKLICHWKNNKNYTVTDLEVAFRVIVLSWFWRVRFSRHIFPAGYWMYKYRQIMYLLVSAPLNGTVLSFSLKQLISKAITCFRLPWQKDKIWNK